MADHELKASDFVHLHNHTQYSLLDGLTKVGPLLDFVAANGMKAVAITDHGSLSGAIEFYDEAISKGIKPIIGLEAYVASRTMADRDPAKDKASFHLTILAMNNIGYKNLMALSSAANLNGFYYRPRIDHVLIEKYQEGLIILSGCINGEVADSLHVGQYDKAKEIAQWYKQVFGDRYYIEIQDHGHPQHPTTWPDQTVVNEQLIKLAKELNIPCVLTCDAHYLMPEDQMAHEVLLCIQTGAFLSDNNRFSMKNIELHVTDPQSIINRWGKQYPDLIKNSRRIADRCEVKIELDKILIPKFEVPQGETEKSFLHRLVYQGLTRRYCGYDESKSNELSIVKAKKKLPLDIKKRAMYELEVIDQMNFNGYFLIIADFITWGKNQGIIFGPGRGSAAGSIIAYALKITELDPLSYDLLFERFLNPDRISMPDIDIDIQDTRRDEVIEYCVEKYGADRVANIVTFGRLAARNALRDVARVLQMPYAEADRLAKMLPMPNQGRHIPLATSLKNVAELKAEYERNVLAKQVFDLAVQLEGTIRSHGVHAAGVVIAPDTITKFTPLEIAQKGVVATQYSMNPIEHLGLLKIDFLGLSNLTIIKDAISIIGKVYGHKIDITKIPLDDKKTFSLLAHGDTTGVFQFESSGMKRYLKQLKPTVFEDIVAMGALYRPGPMQFIDDFIARKNGLREIQYFHPKMEAALKNTYGVLVYQEQVMQISKDLCGFTGGQADTLRKGIAKKIPSVLAKMKVNFIEGAVKFSKADHKQMEQLWHQLEDFAAYCFNKSHAACYGLISYQTAYLKAHYPPAFMAALMTSNFDNTDRLAVEITECQHMGIEVLPPDINESFVNFGVMPIEKAQIRFGMSAIKNVGVGAVEEIVRERTTNGKFSSIENFLSRVNTHIVNRKVMESLIKAGAFDNFQDRSTLLHNLDSIIAYASQTQKNKQSGQTDLFGSLEKDGYTPTYKLALEMPDQQFTEREQLQWERELLGLFLSQNPIQIYEAYLQQFATPIKQLSEVEANDQIIIGGSVTAIREVTTKNGQKMAFISVEDKTGEIEVVIFPRVYQKNNKLWERDRVLIIAGSISQRDNNNSPNAGLKIIAEAVEELSTEYLKSNVLPQSIANLKQSAIQGVTKNSTLTNNHTIKPERVYIRLQNSNDQQTLLSLKAALDKFKGDTEVVLVLGPANNTPQIIKLPARINKQSETLSHLMDLVGKDNVKVK
jgi:DNA polymerase-3 subunit alpha